MTGAQQTGARLRAGKLIPVIRTDSPAQAVDAAAALVDGGIEALEITLTIPGALGCLETLAARHGDRIVLGAGSVLDAASAAAAIAAGARFIVSPHLNPAVVATSRRHGAFVIAGALSPTEIVTAWELGADWIKVFPCDAVGGPAYIRALRGPLPQIPLAPTGGVGLENAAAYLAAGAVALGVGSSLVSAADCRAGRWEALRDRAQALRQRVADAPP